MQQVQGGGKAVDGVIGGDAFDAQRFRCEVGGDEDAARGVAMKHRGAEPDAIGKLQHALLDVAVDAEAIPVALGQAHHDAPAAQAHEEAAVAVARAEHGFQLGHGVEGIGTPVAEQFSQRARHRTLHVVHDNDDATGSTRKPRSQDRPQTAAR